MLDHVDLGIGRVGQQGMTNYVNKILLFKTRVILCASYK